MGRVEGREVDLVEAVAELGETVGHGVVVGRKAKVHVQRRLVCVKKVLWVCTLSCYPLKVQELPNEGVFLKCRFQACGY